MVNVRKDKNIYEEAELRSFKKIQTIFEKSGLDSFLASKEDDIQAITEDRKADKTSFNKHMKGRKNGELSLIAGN